MASNSCGSGSGLSSHHGPSAFACRLTLTVTSPEASSGAVTVTGVSLSPAGIESSVIVVVSFASGLTSGAFADGDEDAPAASAVNPSGRSTVTSTGPGTSDSAVVSRTNSVLSPALMVFGPVRSAASSPLSMTSLARSA